MLKIRGESPAWVIAARQIVRSEHPAMKQIWVTNQGTDSHLMAGTIGTLQEALLPGTGDSSG